MLVLDYNMHTEQRPEKNGSGLIMKLDASQIMKWIMPFPTLAFIVCVALSLVRDFEDSTATHCREARNYLPSISAVIGGFVPQRYIWRVCIAFHSAPRFALGICLHRVFGSACGAASDPGWRSFHRGLVRFMTTTYLFENSCLLILSFVSSTENYAIHSRSFVGFVIFSELYMITTIVLLRCRRSSILFSAIDQQSLHVKQSLFALNILCVLLGSYFYIRHNNYCETGVYTAFALCEYIIVASNIAFHCSSAVYDLKHVNFVAYVPSKNDALLPF